MGEATATVGGAGEGAASVVRVLPMKLPHYADHKESDTERCERAPLKVWAFLRDFSEHRVIVRGRSRETSVPKAPRQGELL